jgi:hypothetical protein
VACLVAGRLCAGVGLLACLTRVFFGRPAPLWRAGAATVVGLALLGEAASLLDDHRVLADELARALGLSALLVGGAVVRAGLARAPRGADPRREAAGLACAAGFAGAALWLRRRARPDADQADLADLEAAS